MASRSLDRAGAQGGVLPRAGLLPRLSARSRAIVWLTLAFWLSNFALLTLGTALSGNPHLAGIAGMRALVMLLGLGLCWLIHRLLAWPRLSSWQRRVIALAIVAPVCAELFAWLAFFAEMAADPAIGLGGFTWAGAVRTIAYWTWFFLAWAGLYLALSYSFDVQAEKARSAALQAEAHAAQLRALQGQINPHFLFNSLNSVSALILEGEAERAEAMVTGLARFLRAGLAADPMATIPLAEEIALQRAYLEIEQYRYPDLEIDVRVEPGLETAPVPALILQPIVENAVKHGVAGSPPPTRIEIEAERTPDGRLAIAVTNRARPGTKRPAAGRLPGAGIGLANVRQRLALLHGAAQSIEAGPAAGDVWRVRLVLPAEVGR
ncbi:sensor histidine kinase [Sphingosinicella terrae]|uniref:sensor histidine kinase n=1 Tax=Sphingosinicella terrae TaxID=2172047 RepID=UPI000E0D4587|nr:histidine kinase [Sphingosinicella terrae]